MSSLPFTSRFLASTRGRILSHLRRGAATVEELAALFGVTDNAIRSQLAALERDGLVRHEGVRRGSGKPSHLYQLAAEVEPLLSRLYLPLLVNLIEELAGRMSPGELESVMRAAGLRLAASLPPLRGDLAARVRAASALLNSLGGITEPSGGERLTIRGYSCPLSAAVAGRREVCEAVAALLGALLDAPVRERCERDGAPRCRFEVGAPS